MNVPALARGLLPRGHWTSDGITYDPAHLWLLYVLLVFSIVLLPLFTYLRGPRGMPLIGRLAGSAERRGAVVVFAAAIPMMVVEAVFGPDANTGGWERLAYLFPFLYGFLIASDPRFETALRRSRRPALAVACAVTGALVAWAGVINASGAGLGAGVPPGWGALQGLAGWAWIVAIMGFAGSLAAHRGSRPPVRPDPPLAAPRPGWRRAARYANEAVLPFCRAGHRLLRRDPRAVRDAGPAVPRHPVPLRHEAGSGQPGHPHASGWAQFGLITPPAAVHGRTRAACPPWSGTLAAGGVRRRAVPESG